MSTLEQQRKIVPGEPGVYFFKDAAGEVLYIGKAKNLHRRIHSHFTRPAGERGQKMIERTRDLEWIVLGSEHEALVAEQNFIRRYQPHYNVRLKDDRSYPWIAVSLDEEYPRIFLTRERHRRGRKYFGPYPDSRSARRIADLIGRVFQLRSCTGKQPGRATGSPCLDFHIGRCSAPCTNRISKAAYRAQAEQAVACLAGGYGELRDDLKNRMSQASHDQNYEAAARYRDLIEDLETLTRKQKVAGLGREDFDLAALHLEGENGNMQVWRVRGGALEGQVSFYLQNSGQSREEIFLAALLDYYDSQETVPGKILVDPDFAESREGQGLGQLLELDRGAGIKVSHTHRGPKHQLWQSLCRNVHLALGREQLRQQAQSRRTGEALEELSQILGSADLAQRIECYDVSHLGGTHSYVSMVVFDAGIPQGDHYRVFRIEDDPGHPDDYRSLGEALERRTGSWQNFSEMSPYDPRVDQSFSRRPDLILIDGGAGQLAAAQEALEPMLEAGTQILSLAKEHEEIYLPGQSRPLRLANDNPARLLLQHARDEAHRFALRSHRRSRDKTALQSQLDDISGVGPARRRQLLQAFGSVEHISKASLAELVGVVPEKVAQAVHDYFNHAPKTTQK